MKIKRKSIKAMISIIQAMTWKTSQKTSWFINLSEGNKKLKPSADVRYLIWNLPAVKTCPFATEMCKKACYAKKAECGARPSVLPCRIRNFKRSAGTDFIRDMIFTITAYCNRPCYRNARTVVIRIHESGDFYNREYAKSWLKIARQFQGNDRIVFMAYTKSVEYFEGLQIPDNFKLRYSLWADTDPKQYEKAVKMGLPVYTAVDSFTTEKPINRCLCKNCSTCQKCWHDINMLMCEIH